ncbi:MAG: DeoR/GlpR family DNA-binding transcription regulator [Cytophagales bacterium]|nr:DeoR/GlpR family DNA-binding transcription regulator [Cytophagales bacterium]
MLKEERHNYILNEVRIHSRVLLTDLTQQLNVSEDTVRRDLKELDEQGMIRKVHGGAISNGYNLNHYQENKIYAHDSKAKIAKKASGLIKDGQVILMSGGTTNLELARSLPEQLKATFFTPSLTTALELLNHENSETIFIGGKLSQEAKIAVGGSVINTLSEIQADICFLGTGFLDPNSGLTEFDWEVVQMKKAMINATKKVIALTISEKLNSVQKYKVCDVQALDMLITELDPNHEQLASYQNSGVNLL